MWVYNYVCDVNGNHLNHTEGIHVLHCRVGRWVDFFFKQHICASMKRIPETTPRFHSYVNKDVFSMISTFILRFERELPNKYGCTCMLLTLESYRVCQDIVMSWKHHCRNSVFIALWRYPWSFPEPILTAATCCRYYYPGDSRFRPTLEQVLQHIPRVRRVFVGVGYLLGTCWHLRVAPTRGFLWCAHPDMLINFGVHLLIFHCHDYVNVCWLSVPLEQVSAWWHTLFKWIHSLNFSKCGRIYIRGRFPRNPWWSRTAEQDLRFNLRRFAGH